MSETPKQFTDYGWANSWKKKPDAVAVCQKAGHKVSDNDIGPPMRGIHHVVECTICQYRYHYDSSD